MFFFFFFSSRRRHTRYWRDWSSDVCSSDLRELRVPDRVVAHLLGVDAPDPLLVGPQVPPVPLELPETRLVASALGAGEPFLWLRAAHGAPGLSVAAGAFA